MIPLLQYATNTQLCSQQMQAVLQTATSWWLLRRSKNSWIRPWLDLPLIGSAPVVAINICKILSITKILQLNFHELSWIFFSTRIFQSSVAALCITTLNEIRASFYKLAEQQVRVIPSWLSDCASCHSYISVSEWNRGLRVFEMVLGFERLAACG